MKIIFCFKFLTRAILAGLCCLALPPVGQANAKEDTVDRVTQTVPLDSLVWRLLCG